MIYLVVDGGHARPRSAGAGAVLVERTDDEVADHRPPRVIAARAWAFSAAGSNEAETRAAIEGHSWARMWGLLHKVTLPDVLVVWSDNDEAIREANKIQRIDARFLKPQLRTGGTIHRLAHNLATHARRQPSAPWSREWSGMPTWGQVDHARELYAQPRARRKLDRFAPCRGEQHGCQCSACCSYRASQLRGAERARRKLIASTPPPAQAIQHEGLLNGCRCEACERFRAECEAGRQRYIEGKR